MKISISCDWGGTIALYDLKRDVGLLEHIDIICKELKAPDPSANYALFNETNNTYIKPEVPTSLQPRPIVDSAQREESFSSRMDTLIINLYIFPGRPECDQCQLQAA